MSLPSRNQSDGTSLERCVGTVPLVERRVARYQGFQGRVDSGGRTRCRILRCKLLKRHRRTDPVTNPGSGRAVLCSWLRGRGRRRRSAGRWRVLVELIADGVDLVLEVQCRLIETLVDILEGTVEAGWCQGYVWRGDSADRLVCRRD